jgi:serine protease AprX
MVVYKKYRNAERFCHPMIILLLLITFVFAPTTPLQAQAAPPNAHPWLLQLAKERPNEKVQVIVQRKAAERIPPQALERAGGKVTKELPIINGFVMELPARAVEALARSKGVRWISLDAPMRAANITEGFGEEGFSVSATDLSLTADMALQSDGKFVVVGHLDSEYDHFNTIRYHADGTRDTGFGANGLVTTTVSRNIDYAKAVVVQPDGKIVIAGNGYFGRHNYNLFVVRYHNNGTLDSSFGVGGIVTTAVGNQTSDEAADILLQPDGKLVVVGVVRAETGCHITLVRYLSNGTLDRNFGNSGTVFAPLNSCAGGYQGYNEGVYGAALQTDGKIIVVGSDTGTNFDFLVVRFQTNGTVDTSFGNSGYVRTPMGAYNDSAGKVVIQPDGKIVVAGHVMTGAYSGISTSNTGVVRYLTNGTLDPTFGVGGKVIADYSLSRVSGLALQSTGKIVVSTHNGGNYITLMRLDTNGLRDYQFNRIGYTFYFSFHTASSQAMIVLPDDKIVVSGYKWIRQNEGWQQPSGLARLTADGALNMGTSPYVRAVGATKLWTERPELLGDGITVAVVDSGVNAHVELQDASQNSRIKAHWDFTGVGDVTDRYGHGTHVAGIVGSNGSTTSGQRIGMAPNVNLLNVKVSNEQGMSRMSDVVASLQWIFENKSLYNIRVVNLSLNSTVPESYHVNPLSAAVEILWFNGVTVVVAAGNNGTGTGPVDLLPPANDPFVITVGAIDSMGTINISDDVVAFFSAYGTTLDGHQKPDIVAPGRNIVSLLASSTSWIYQNRTAHRLDESLFRMSGTSMATPVVSGAIALLLQDEPNLTPDQVKHRLKATANKVWAGYDPAKAGAGYLDIYAAVNGTTTQNANTGLLPSQMLFTGTDPVAWDSVSWNSVSWNSVSWNSVSWNSVSWNSDTWMTNIWDEGTVGAASAPDLGEGGVLPIDPLVAHTDEMPSETLADVNLMENESGQQLYLPLIAQP